ncbi:ribonuclease HII [Bacillus timonensis]|nr:ribonuclease HII [Bacillus timonensis]
MVQQTIKEIEQVLERIVDSNDPILKTFENDKRKGVQILLNRWFKKKEQEKKSAQLFKEMMMYEDGLYNRGVNFIAGVDEVGRGPLAGPVVASSVILPKDFFLPGINDSKKLSDTKREELFKEITDSALSIGIGIVTAKQIDEINIYQATKLAMKKAINNLSVQPDHLLIDAMDLDLNIPQTSIIKGDAKSVSIAASSIIAKVTRDRLMKELAIEYPNYGFENHMGYGTSYHMEALHEFGITEEHRLTFSPIKEMIEK